MTFPRRIPALVSLLAVAMAMRPGIAASLSSDDAHIAALVRERLQESDAASTIHLSEVAVNQGVVVLTGTVRTRYARAEAERVVTAVPGVQHVQARLRIEPNP